MAEMGLAHTKYVERKGKLMLKYERMFKVGDTIRAMDFEPRDGVPDRFIEGVVTDIRLEGAVTDARVYVIDITRDSGAEANEKVTSRVGDEGYVPMDVGYFDWYGRISLGGSIWTRLGIDDPNVRV